MIRLQPADSVALTSSSLVTEGISQPQSRAAVNSHDLAWKLHLPMPPDATGQPLARKENALQPTFFSKQVLRTVPEVIRWTGSQPCLAKYP